MSGGRISQLRLTPALSSKPDKEDAAANDSSQSQDIKLNTQVRNSSSATELFCLLQCQMNTVRILYTALRGGYGEQSNQLIFPFLK